MEDDLGFDFDVDDETIEKIQKEELKNRKQKGGEKVNLRERPYLEVVVVEVETKKKEEIPEYCVKCNKKEGCTPYKNKYKKLEKQGNWINGENLSKIKFPCACSYDGYEGTKYGILTRGFVNGKSEYLLHEVRNGQCLINSVEGRFNDLEELMTLWNIHIEKAKIVIFKEIK